MSAQQKARVQLLVGAIGFVLFFLSGAFITPNLASGSMPLPNDPVAQTRTWYADNPAAIVAIGLSQVVSVLCLALFVHALGRVAASAAQKQAMGKARLWGYGAVALMVASSVSAWVLAAVAPSASLDTVSVLRAANFIAGGTAHVAALGIFVLLASRTPGFGKGIRGFAWVVAVPAVASLISLAVFQGAALILVGRLLAMVWTISTAISANRALARGTWQSASPAPQSADH